jgi:hypothetical protein
MAMRRAFPPWLPVVDKLRTLTELDAETVEVLTPNLGVEDDLRTTGLGSMERSRTLGLR